jgi:molecular chaperone GrpE (heat shock protein)
MTSKHSKLNSEQEETWENLKKVHSVVNRGWTDHGIEKINEVIEEFNSACITTQSQVDQMAIKFNKIVRNG